MYANSQATKPSGVEDGSVKFFNGRRRPPRNAQLTVSYDVLSSVVYS